MYTNRNFGFSKSLLSSIAEVMLKNRNMTKEQIQERIDSGVWSADTPILEGKEALFYDRQLNRRFSVNVIEEKKELDPVNKKAVKKDFDDRKDKDIDNDGDTDDSDEYLHKRRKAISKAMKDEASCGTKRMKEDEDLKEAEQVVTLPKGVGFYDTTNYPIGGKFDRVTDSNGLKVTVKRRFKLYKGTDTEGMTSDGKKVAFQMRLAKEDVDLEEETVYVKRRYNNLGANQYSNDVGFAKKISNAASKLGLTAKMNDKNFVISGDPEKIATLKKTVKGVTFSMKEDIDLEEGKKGYKKESDDSSNDERMTDAQKYDMDGDGDKDKKSKKKKSERDKVDTVDIDPEMKDDTMVQEEKSFKTPYGTVKVTKRDTKGMKGSQDPWMMTLHMKDGKTKNLGSHPNPTDSAVNSIVKRHMSEERSPENRKLASHEKEKLDDLKKKHEGGKMHRNLKRRYGEKGDEIFYGKLTKMAKGEYDGSETKSEEFVMTVEDLNNLDELQRLGQEWALEEARGRPKKEDEADDAGSKNIIMQLRKAVSLRGQHSVKFADGSTVKVDQKKAQAFLDRYNRLNKPAEKEALMKSAAKSPKHLDMAIQGKVASDKKVPMLPPLASEK